MHTPKARHSMLALGGTLLALSLGACGTSASHVTQKWGDAVARVGRYTITLPELKRWTHIESVLSYTYKPVTPVPPGVIPEPPDYTACIDLAAKTASPGSHPSRASLKARCAIQYKAIQGHILEILITNDWTREEARTQGVSVGHAELQHMMSYEFADLKRFQRLTGEREGDEQFIVEGELLLFKLQKKAASKPGLSSAQQEAAEGDFENGVLARWTPRTSCAPGHVIYMCKEYKRPAA